MSDTALTAILTGGVAALGLCLLAFVGWLAMRTPKVRRISLKPGDRLIYETDRLVTHEEADRIKTQMRHAFPDHEVLVVSEGHLVVQTEGELS